MTIALHDRVLPGNFLKRIQSILDENNNRCHRTEYSISTGRRLKDKSVSKKTTTERALMVKRIYAEIWQLGFRIQDPSHLKEKHVEALIKKWVEDGCSAAYIQTRTSALRVFAQWMGKAGLVKPSPLLCQNGEARRERAAKSTKSWVGNGVSAEAVIEKARALDERMAVMLLLQAEFGLRVKESIELHPAQVLSMDRGHIVIWEGTKGGRQRLIPISKDSQRAALEEAIQLCLKHSAGRMRWPNLTWRQAQSRFYRLAAKLGIRHSELGITAHGLRHEFAQDGYTERTGQPTPVEGGTPSLIDRELHRAASLDVSKLLGHSRLSVTTSYYGSYGHQLRSPVRCTFSFQKELKESSK